MEVADDTNILSGHRCQVLYCDRQQILSDQFRENEPLESNVGISQTQGQGITFGKEYCEGGHGEDREFVARVTATPRGYIIWASPTSLHIDNIHTHLRYTTSPRNR